MPKDKLYDIRKSKDEMEATLTVNFLSGDDEPNFEDAKKELQEAGIVHGIDEDKLKKIFDEKLYNQEFVIAKGTPKVDGIDAKLKYFFDPNKSIRPQEDEKGNVDYKDVNIISNVRKGDKLVELIPPVQGKDGTAVTGRSVIAKQGKMARLPSGRNTIPDPEKPNFLIANADGDVVSTRGLIEVNEVFEVKGNVDYSTGNIEFVGSVIIKGDVKSGFKVSADGDIEIWGVVEDAEISSKANVLLKKGISGRGQGKIIADGNVYLKFCENQNIYAKKNIVVGEELMHSNIECEGKIIVNGKKGLILGGKVSGTLGIEAKSIGNYQHVKTDLIVGVKEELRNKLEKIEENLRKNDENFENVKKAIYNLVKIKIDKGGLPDDKKALMDKLQNLQKLLPKQRENLQKEKDEILKEYSKYAGAEIKVYNEIYPGVRVFIQNLKKNINEERKNVTISVKDNEIRIV